MTWTRYLQSLHGPFSVEPQIDLKLTNQMTFVSHGYCLSDHVSSARRDAWVREVGAYIGCPLVVRVLNSSLQCVLSWETSNKTVPCIDLVWFLAGIAVNQRWTGGVTPYVPVAVMAGLHGFVGFQGHRIGRSQFLWQ